MIPVKSISGLLRHHFGHKNHNFADKDNSKTAVCCSAICSAVFVPSTADDVHQWFRSTLYNTLQHTATHCNTRQDTARHGNTLQQGRMIFINGFDVVSINSVRGLSRHHSADQDGFGAAAYCNNTLQHTATNCNTVQHTATHCNTLQDTATLCITLQHSATICNNLQHSATPYNTLQCCMLSSLSSVC